MQYVIADIHGYYESFLRLLEAIHFSDDDTLYVLGDSVDRGPDPIRLLIDLSMRPNVYHIMGNHEFMALTCLRKMMVEITEENCETQLDGNDIRSYLHWMRDGGETTVEQFRRLMPEEQEALIEYMEEMPLYEIVQTDKGIFALVHAGIADFVPGKALSEYTETELLFERSDYGRRYFEHAVLVTGHTPVQMLSEEVPPKVLFLTEKNQIAADCGKCYGGRLACICLDTLDVLYE